LTRPDPTLRKAEYSARADSDAVRSGLAHSRRTFFAPLAKGGDTVDQIDEYVLRLLRWACLQDDTLREVIRLYRGRLPYWLHLPDDLVRRIGFMLNRLNLTHADELESLDPTPIVATADAHVHGAWRRLNADLVGREAQMRKAGLDPEVVRDRVVRDLWGGGERFLDSYQHRPDLTEDQVREVAIWQAMTRRRWRS
jgi:hypothetical protein